MAFIEKLEKILMEFDTVSIGRMRYIPVPADFGDKDSEKKPDAITSPKEHNSEDDNPFIAKGRECPVCKSCQVVFKCEKCGFEWPKRAK